MSYNEPGTYIVTLRIINLAGDDTATMMTIKITAPRRRRRRRRMGTPTPDADAHAHARDVRDPAQHHGQEPDERRE